MHQPTVRTCAVDGCDRPHLSRGWCGTHYARWRKHGDPGTAAIQKQLRGFTAEEKYAEYADTSGGPDACWPWTGPQANEYGYGLLMDNGKRLFAHRWALERKLGRKLRRDEDTRHDCDRPVCVNPTHLRPGSRKDNMGDAIERGRAVTPINARLNAAKVDCHRGHPLSGGNLYVNPKGERQCRACAAIRHNAYMERKRLRQQAAS